MWRFLKGVEKPKRKQTPEEKKEKDKEYEKKRRKRDFLDEWCKGRSWLRFDSDSQAMFCDYCINAGVEPEKSSFVKGCTNIKLGPIKVHQASNSHLYSTTKYLNDNAPQDAPAVRAHISLNKDVARKLSVLFRNVHALNIKARPLTDYLFLSELDEKRGLICLVIDTKLVMHVKSSQKL